MNVFLETIQDVPIDGVRNTPAGLMIPKAAATLRRRVVLHETMHRFHYGPHDQGVMDYDTAFIGDDVENELTVDLLRNLYYFDPAGSKGDF